LVVGCRQLDFNNRCGGLWSLPAEKAQQARAEQYF